MNKAVMLYILGTLLILSMSFVSSAPPFESTSTGGLQFGYSPYEVVKANQDFYLHIHVINDTAIQTNATTSCMVHLYKPNGEHLLESDLGWDSNNVEFKLDIDAGNFTVGQHAYILICNNTNKQIHEVNGLFVVTPTGENYSQSFLIALVIAMALISGLLFYVSTLFTLDNAWVKLLFISLGLGGLILTAQVGLLGSNGSIISKVFVTAQVIMISIFSLFIAYLFIIQFKQTIQKFKNAKRNRIQAKYGEIVD